MSIPFEFSLAQVGRVLGIQRVTVYGYLKSNRMAPVSWTLRRSEFPDNKSRGCWEGP
jgi:hypothetical protein